MTRSSTLFALAGLAAGGSFAAVPAVAQQPEQPRFAPVTGHLNTPGRAEFSRDVLDRLQTPPGFDLDIFAEGLENPRMLAVHSGGTVYVSEREPGQVTALRDTDGNGSVDSMDPVVTGRPYVHGLAIRDDRLYMMTNKELLVADIRQDGLLGEVETLVDGLPDGGQHPNRTLAFGPDGQLYMSVGSSCNACDEPDPRHATMMRANPDGSDLQVFAEGLRNTVGFGWHPETGEMWGLDMGSDWRGDDTPPDELNLIAEGKHYGWPWCWGDAQVDMHIPGEPQDAESREAFCERTESPVLDYTAHASPLMMAFYTGDQFPEEYRGDAFVTFRGSWNRNPPSGYKVARLRFEDGRPAGFEDLVTGFLSEDGRTHYARLAGITQALDGSLLFSDDTNGVIYRLSYSGDATASDEEALP
ncbi:PQQ-dependent sugar dehydrogenase [Skermanella pratensis]|uniref:PQQ-dependent sugar dehydrogenase n=1 Tax=Skermanella pratensis TaxID=2233999 RepID=UPI0013018954|nr:PQQ-dependent sugar dehydrogenase [Skermanella pratensis]